MSRRKTAAWQIETGGQSWRRVDRADTSEIQAAVDAFALRAPKNPGYLTRARKIGTYVWMYLDTRMLLQRAGYEVRSR